MQKTDDIKLILLGESQVGKSSLLMQFAKGQNKQLQDATIGAAFLTQNISLDEGIVKFEIWNTAGQDRYHSLAPMYYRSAKAALIVYDITRMETFNRAKLWVKELRRVASPEIVIALAGNSLGSNSSRTVAYEEANAYAEEYGLLFKEISEKDTRNVTEVFLEIAQRVRFNLELADSFDTNANVEIKLRAGHTGLQGENKCCCYLL